MKKSVKMLIAAACVTSIVGVGAVSFAKWDPNTVNDASGTLTNGYIALSGFTSNKLEMGDKTLMPYDQGDVESTETKIISVAIPEYQVSSDYTLTAKVETALPAGKYYVKLTTNATEAVPNATTGWTELTATGASLTLGDLAYTAGGTVLKTINNAYLHIILDSNSGNDMNAESTISLKLAEVNS